MKLYAPLSKFLLCLAVVMVGVGCNSPDSVVDPDANVKTEPPSLLKAGLGGQIWADCELFGTVGTPTSFKPSSGNFDELYNGANFKGGVGAISESKPGDRDYNGGRWHVNALKKDVNPNKYNDVCNVDYLDKNDFESTETYFECPLLPRRGNN